MITLRDNETLTNNEILALINKIKALIYVRVSTAEQAKSGYSLDSQIERCVELASNKFEYTEDELLVVIEGGQAGDNPDRNGLNTVLYLLEQGLGKKLIILHPDRLSRYLSLQTEISQKVWNTGCDLVFVEFDIDPDNPESMLNYNIQGSIAQYNKSKILANSKRGRFQKVKAGKMNGGRKPFGYDFDKVNDVLVENKHEKELFLQMVDWVINDNLSCLQIAKRLSEMGTTPPKSESWYGSTVQRILKNEIYTGIYYYGKTEIIQKNGKKTRKKKPKEEWIPIPVPKYIDKETHEQIKLKISSGSTHKKGRPSEFNILKGLLFCGRCGSRISISGVSRTKTNQYKYYGCTKKMNSYKDGTSNEVCKGRTWRVDFVNDYVWNEIVKYLENPDEIVNKFRKANKKDNGEVENLVKKKEELTNVISEKQEERKRYFKLFGTGKIDEDTLEELSDPIDKIIEYNTNQIAKIDSVVSNYKKSNEELKKLVLYLSSYGKRLKSGKITPEYQREFIQRFVERITLYDDGTIDIQTKWKLEPDTTDDTKHRKQSLCHTESSVLYVDLKGTIDNHNPNSTNGYKPWTSYINQLDKLIDMYQNKLMSVNEISRETNIGVRSINNLFKHNNVKKISHSERLEMKRKKDFNKFYDLYINKGKSLNQIADICNCSRGYVTKSLEENGIKIKSRRG